MQTAYVIGLFKVTVDANTGDNVLPSVAQVANDMQLPRTFRKYITLDLCTKLATVTGDKYTIAKKAARIAAKNMIRKYEIYYPIK